jgi:hypothetical protein
MDEKLMKKWQEAATPGQEHQILESLVGNWQVSAKMWMDGPQEPPLESSGTASLKWILDRHFVEEEFSGQMMGRPFIGKGVYGYENFTKRYQFVWLDNGSTGIFTGNGTYDEKVKALIFSAKMNDPVKDVRDKPIACVIRIASRDKHTFEMYDSPKPDAKFKTGEITYIRK